jgi:hypothetical protein
LHNPGKILTSLGETGQIPSALKGLNPKTETLYGIITMGLSHQAGLSMNLREARLKPEFAAEYPGLEPAVWMSATELAGKLIDRARTRRKEGRYTRTFDPTHFEFRGGSTIPRWPRDRTRSTDPQHQPLAENQAESRG